MKKVIISVAVISLLGAFTVSCQKEADPVPSTVYSQSKYNVRYSIDNHIYHANLQTYEEWHTFLSNMLALSRQHHRISIHKNGNNQTIASKEKVVFKTPDPEEASAWAEEMLLAGYNINMEFDEETGYYIVTAIRE